MPYTCNIVDGLQSDRVELKYAPAGQSTLIHPASIGPGGIEIFALVGYKLWRTRLQSDRVELKYMFRGGLAPSQRASIGPGGIEINLFDAIGSVSIYASIGPGGIEIGDVAGFAAGELVLQSDRVELK